MATVLKSPGFAKGESGAAPGLARVLNSSDPGEIRALFRNSGMPGGDRLPWADTGAGLLAAMPGWSGKLDLTDAQSSELRREFCHPHGG